MDDKKLGTCSVHVVGTCHGYGTSGVRQVVGHAVGGKFALDGILGAAGTVAKRVTALHHESVDDAVEAQSVIKTVFCQFQKIAHSYGSHIAVEFDLDGAHISDFYFHMMDAGLFCSAACHAKDHGCSKHKCKQFFHFISL